MDAPGQDGVIFQGRMDARGWDGCSGGTQLPPLTLPSCLTAVAGALSLSRCAAPHLEPPTRSSRAAEAGSLPAPHAPAQDRGLGTAWVGGLGCPSPPSQAAGMGMAQLPAPSATGAGCHRTQPQLFSHYYHYYY